VELSLLKLQLINNFLPQFLMPENTIDIFHDPASRSDIVLVLKPASITFAAWNKYQDESSPEIESSFGLYTSLALPREFAPTPSAEPSTSQTVLQALHSINAEQSHSFNQSSASNANLEPQSIADTGDSGLLHTEQQLKNPVQHDQKNEVSGLFESLDHFLTCFRPHDYWRVERAPYSRIKGTCITDDGTLGS